MRALACPSSLKGVLSARDAAAALAEGLRTCADADELPIADGGEGTLDALHAVLGGVWHEVDAHDAFGRPRTSQWLELPDGTAAVEAAQVIPLDPARLDPMRATSRGLGEMILVVGRPPALLVCLGGTANVDGGAGMREVLHTLPSPTRVVCDVDVPLADAARVFAAQKGASPERVRELESRLLGMEELAPFADRGGAGAAGGLGAAFAALGAELLPGAPFVLDAIGFEPRGYDLVVTGEGTVDATTMQGKAAGEVVRRCEAANVRCVLFGGRVVDGRAVALSGDPARARDDLVELGARLAGTI